MNILAVDFGTKNIGLAWCDTGIGVVLPYGVISNKDRLASNKELSELVVKEKIDKVVIGLPLSMNGQENDNTKRVRQFGEDLKNSVDARIEYFDERFSSQQADRSAGGASRDEKSAMVILESYLESH